MADPAARGVAPASGWPGSEPSIPGARERKRENRRYRIEWYEGEKMVRDMPEQVRWEIEEKAIKALDMILDDVRSLDVGDLYGEALVILDSWNWEEEKDGCIVLSIPFDKDFEPTISWMAEDVEVHGKWEVILAWIDVEEGGWE